MVQEDQKLEWSRLFPDHVYSSRMYDALIRGANGEEIFRLDGVTAPFGWSDLSIDIAAQKYLIRRNAKTPSRKETSIFQMMEGVASTIAECSSGLRYFKALSYSAFQKDLLHLLLDQRAAFNSPVWFNVRHWHQHGISGSGGNWAWNFGTTAEGYEQVVNGYERPQCSACFITSIDDSLVGPGGIADQLTTEFRIFKRGSGVGSNFSALREKNAPLSGGGGSSGLMSFLEVFDRAAGSTKSGGTTRRAAKMVVLDVDHPEIEAFIDWKVREERKARDLIAAGWSKGMEGEAYTTVAGQNSNNSVRLSDEFMHAVRDDRSWNLFSRVDGRPTKTLRARDLWDKIAQAAWEVADPGVQFDTTINHWHTTPNAGRINASNPCSEYMHLDNSACNLSSIRLTKYLQSDGTFDVTGFKNTCETMIVAQDILVDLSSYPTRAIAKGAHKFRQLGLGYADLGALLMLMGLPYDSDGGRYMAAQITSLMTAQAYLTSAKLARALGPFEGFQADRENVLRVIDLHRREAKFRLKSDSRAMPREAYHIHQEAELLWDEAYKQAELYGVRNAQVTLLAPTGTIGFLMGCTTTGVEPLLAHRQYKRLVGGGDIMILNEIVPQILKNMGFNDAQCGEISAHVEKTGGFYGAPHLADYQLPVFDTALPAPLDPTKRHIAPMAHVKMIAAVQPFLSGAVSKTVNMPQNATVQDIKDIYWAAWEMGVKAIAIYRDESKGAQPVRTEAEDSKKPVSAPAPTVATPVSNQRKLPKVRRGLTWAVTLDGHKVFIRSGEYEDGTLGEVFVDLAKEGSTLGGLVGMWSKTLSIALQYGTPFEKLVEKFTFTRFEPFGRVADHDTIRTATSIPDLVMRVLAVHYLKRTDLQHVQAEVVEDFSAPLPLAPDSATGFTDRSGDGPPCPDCGWITKRNGTCHRCPNCGLSLGCS